MLRVFLPDNLSPDKYHIRGMSLTFDFNFVCLFSFKKRPSTVLWRTLWVQPTLKVVKTRHGMNENLIAV